MNYYFEIRWGHLDVVIYLLENIEYPEKDLKRCFSLAITVEMKEIINRFIKKKLIKKPGEEEKNEKNFLDNFLNLFCC